jgi:flagellar biosynthesis protein FlhF
VRIKRFKAQDTKTAMQMVKAEMGPDAVILGTREIKEEGLPAAVEITAGVNYQPPPTRPEPVAPNRPETDQVKPLTGYPGMHRQIPGPAEQTVAGTDYGPAINGLENGLAEIKDILLDLTHRLSLSEKLRDRKELLKLYRDLLDAELDPAIARALVEKVGTQGNGHRVNPQKVLLRTLAGLLPTNAPLSGPAREGPLYAAIIGPTGVGKTTTLAKLAALWSVKEQKKVGIISLDTFRLGAAEQLKTYARIMGLPVRIAQDKEEFNQAAELFEKLDLVLVDTSGRALSRAEDMNELAEIIASIRDMTVMLVLSAVTKDRDLSATIVEAERLSAQSLIISKIDETRRYGNVINNLIKFKKPVSFLTNGQKVPDDILPASPGLLAELITVQEKGC